MSTGIQFSTIRFALPAVEVHQSPFEELPRRNAQVLPLW